MVSWFSYVRVIMSVTRWIWRLERDSDRINVMSSVSDFKGCDCRYLWNIDWEDVVICVLYSLVPTSKDPTGWHKIHFGIDQDSTATPPTTINHTYRIWKSWGRDWLIEVGIGCKRIESRNPKVKKAISPIFEFLLLTSCDKLAISFSFSCSRFNL